MRGKDLYRVLLLTLLALGVRLAYWQTIPAAGDEVAQGIYAVQIARGEKQPLVANDAYDGPFFVYLLAGLYRLGVKDPLLGRTVILITGTLIAPLTYLWVRRLPGSPLAGLVAGGLIVTNPHLVLINSHIGGTSQLLPFFTTLFLWLASGALATDHPGWLMAAAVAGGLALQANLAAVLLVAGVTVWLALGLRASPRLGRRWPLWPLAMGLALALVYSPVIVYNLMSVKLGTVTTLQQRPYLWQTDPTIFTFLTNLVRLLFQLVRQMSGVVLGDETWRTILGAPLLYAAWAIGGLILVTRWISRLPLATLLPFVVVVPYVSSLYGMLDEGRFTTPFMPVFAAGMGLLAVWAWDRLKAARPPVRRWAQAGLSGAVAALLLWPLVPLSQFYAYANATHQNGYPLLELSRQMVATNKGEAVYISDHRPLPGGIPYVPELSLILAGIQQSFLPSDQIIGRLFQAPGPATLVLANDDAVAIGRVAHIVPWPGAANEEAHLQGYGLYTLDTSTPLVKPDFVLTGQRRADLRPAVALDVPIGGGLRLIGYDLPDHAAPGQTVNLVLYWESDGGMPAGTYMGFAHLFDAQSMQLLAQDDHILGQAQYPVNAWQPGEVVADHYALPLPAGVSSDHVRINIGAYTWPDSIRLTIPGHVDNLVELNLVSVHQ